MPNVHRTTTFRPAGIQSSFPAGNKDALRSREKHHPGRLIRMEEFLVSILARFAYLVVEALIVRLVRAFMPAPASPARA